MNIAGYIARVFVRARIILRGSAVRYAILLCGGRCGRGLRVERGLRVRQGFHHGIHIGNSVYLGIDTTIDCPAGGLLTIGDAVTLTQGVFIGASRSVIIGNKSMIGEYTSIRDSNHGMNLGASMAEQALTVNEVLVSDDVWIGRGCAVLAGSHVGEGAVVGANTVVKGNVLPKAIIAGNPAELIRFRK